MITLYGVTEDGTSVPVQVNDEGKIIAIGQQGPPGQDSQVPGPQGPPGPQGEYGPGDDVVLGNIDASGPAVIGDDPQAGTTNVGTRIWPTGTIYARPGRSNDLAFASFPQGTTTPGTIIRGNGTIEAAGNKCGFTKDGDVYFTSRGDRFRIVVQQGICHADPYTREIELREKAEEVREPKTLDIVDPD